MINILRALIDKNQQHSKTDGQGKQRDENSNREQERKSRIKNIVTEIESTLDGLISRVGTAEQRTFVCEDLIKEISKTE